MHLERTSVDLGGLLRVLSEALYSTPNVAVRELVQNAHDSIVRRRVEGDPEHVGRIRVRADGDSRQLTIEDDGAGLTDEEIRKYLATVGAGYTRQLRDQGVSDALIGYFGLGFLSAFVVAERTELWTCSYQTPELAWRFSTRGGDTYSITEAPGRAVGTQVTLHLKRGFEALADPATLEQVLSRYCALLPISVELVVRGAAPRAINAEAPPWRREDPGSGAATRRRCREFAARFESQFGILWAWPFAVPELGAHGIFWLQDGMSYATSDNRSVSVFVRGMLISAKERELLPAWAGFVGCVVECSGLTPTASREALQRDAGFEALAHALRERLIGGLAQLPRHEEETWRLVLGRHNEALLGAAVSEPALLEALEEELRIPTTEGDLRFSALAPKSGPPCIYASTAETAGFEELLLRALRRPVVDGRRFGALPFSMKVAQRRGLRVVLTSTQAAERDLFHEAELPEPQAQRLRRLFAQAPHRVELRAFEPVELPLVLVPDREAVLKGKIESEDADRRISAGALGLARLFTRSLAEGPPGRLYVNTACPVVQALARGEVAAETAVARLLLASARLWAHGASDPQANISSALEDLHGALLELLRVPEPVP